MLINESGRDVAQAGLARWTGGPEVGGSNPLVPTIFCYLSRGNYGDHIGDQ